MRSYFALIRIRGIFDAKHQFGFEVLAFFEQFGDAL